MSDAFGDLDLAALGRAISYPGIDPRIWVSYGIVDREQDDQKSVEFNGDGGPLVWVLLQPHNQLVACRVASGVAGNGEAEWHPFLEADEVIVLIPEGDTRSTPVIVGRAAARRFRTTGPGARPRAGAASGHQHAGAQRELRGDEPGSAAVSHACAAAVPRAATRATLLDMW